MSNVIDLTEYRNNKQDNVPRFIFACLTMFLGCCTRWVAGIVDNQTSLFSLECPKCHECNSFATIIPPEYMGEFGLHRE